MILSRFRPPSFKTCIIRFKISEELLEPSQRSKLRGICYVSNGSYVSSIRKRKDGDLDYNFFVSKSKVSEGRYYYFCRIYSGKLVENLNKLFENQTMINEYAIFFDGAIHIRFSFYEKYSHIVSNFIKENYENGIEVVYLGNFTNVDAEMKSEGLGLKIITLRMEVPQYLLETDPSTSVKWIRFIRNFNMENFNSLYLIQNNGLNNIPDMFRAVDASIGLYEGETSNEIIQELENMIIETGLRPVISTNEFDGKYLWLEYFVIERDLTSIIRIMGDLKDRNSEWKGLIFKINSASDE
ncbi:MAG: hypothetical protein B2I18_00720 [Cuniculiplasma sp. C_DKE]|jgi:hypothetical protein|uniref:Uncharacterized protein n=3 Tax=Cuniculiplasma divulgatum TaxID=1673428 RepID=A0A1R4A9J7_9ARCH|nr:hypothetical protein [Cuniculiplasma divulgatum]MCI2412044.1 hypothetical protein [Cuniculiplasma sp.]MCL4320410.1 hypothetical protein [Candidatus Thermoplasmatota archaeon]OWP55696.1 MAG: hypothetical protein B2I18_00720 [Cuniculiplasma sp. C_DKE]MCL5788005.1 hypothetical protein [Candidatus Thermoplasmatota archaeon]SJK85643.1 hypothetical protein CPM_1867 [Cuniculiplasma divulgatum]